MSLDATLLYRSSNGDHWSLMHDRASGRRFVRHGANSSSGGHISDTELSDFLSVEGSGPEYAALRRLLDAEAAGTGTESRIGQAERDSASFDGTAKRADALRGMVFPIR